MMTAMISPAPDEDVEEIARLLLGIAGDYPHLIASTMDGPFGLAFVVPDWIAEEYVTKRFPADDASQEEAPAPKRRGRPPKKQAAPEESGTNGEEE